MQKNLSAKPKLWSRYFITVILMELVLSIAMTVLDNILAIYADDVTGSKSYGGQLTTAFTLGAILMSLFVGRMIDKRGRKTMALIGFGIYVVTCVGLVLTDTKAVFLALRVIQGFGKAAAQITVVAMASDVIPKSRMAEGMGYDMLGYTMAFAVGPAIGLSLSDGGNYKLVFGVCAGLMVVALVLAATMDYEKTGRYEIERQSDDGRHGISQFVEFSALPGALVRFFINGAASCVIVFVALFSTSVLGYDTLQMTGFYVCGGIGMLVSRLFGKVIDHHDPLIVLIPAFLMMAVCQLLLGFAAATSYVCLLAAGFCFGIEEGLAYPGLRAVTVLDAPDDRKGVVNSMLDFAMDAGIMLGSLFFGFIIDAGKLPKQYDGYQHMFIVGAVCAVMATVLTVIFFNRRARNKRISRYAAEAEK